MNMAMLKLSEPTVIANTLLGADVKVLRLDKIDEIGSGNKYFKLKYNLEAARKAGCRRLISFGGAYSNHIHALALLGQQQGFETIGLIRGEKCDPLNATLADSVAAGMQLYYLNREDYRRRYDPIYLEALKSKFKDCFWIPEGGANVLGVRGCMDIAHYIEPDRQLVILPCATASTMAGLAAACPNQQVLGISVLKNALDLCEQASAHLEALVEAGYIQQQPANWSVAHEYHCGGYAKVNRDLIEFIKWFETQSDISVEPVYSGKMFYALYQLLLSGQIDPSTKIAAIHTGGMQGRRGMIDKGVL